MREFVGGFAIEPGHVFRWPFRELLEESLVDALGILHPLPGIILVPNGQLHNHRLRGACRHSCHERLGLFKFAAGRQDFNADLGGLRLGRGILDKQPVNGLLRIVR